MARLNWPVRVATCYTYDLMSLLIQFVAAVVGLFAAIYMVVATGSILVGFIQFLIELPSAIRQDIDRRRETNAPPPRMIKVRAE